jgi:hypothetical protein
MAAATDNGFPKPSFFDWLALAIGVMFVLAGLVIFRFDRNSGIVTLTLFGLCAGVSVATIVRKLRFRRMRPLRVELVGGVPIKPSRANVLIVSSSIAVLGVVILVFGRHYGLVFWSMGWLLAAIGFLLLLGLATGYLPVGHVQFDPGGITIASRKWAYMIPWDNISQMRAGEYSGNPALFIWLHRDHAVEAQPPELNGKVMKLLAMNTGLIGAPVMLMTSRYGLDLPLLACAMERYVTDPSARAELSRRLLEGGA